ncbi:MAG: nucleotidyltransferase domain-containing protein [Candidatus Aenigmarchaeota archaeon]|nr:nucleotidyltransferase domain-containing protein [Candidatus Aenigmarchaeota archaeon]
MRMEKVRDVLRKRKEILFAYLYGSFAKDEQRRESDVDVGVFLRGGFQGGTFYEVELSLEIERRAGIKNVEVVVLNDKPLRFLNQVLRYGKLIVSNNERERIKFETFVTKSYIDFKPYYEEYDKARVRRLGI